MLQNARVTAFTVSELLRENQLEGGDKITPPPPPTHTHPLGLRKLQTSRLKIDLKIFSGTTFFNIVTYC